MTTSEIEQTENYLTNKYCCKKPAAELAQPTQQSDNVQIKLYPNPVKNNLQIEGLTSKGNIRLTISNYSGITVASTIISGKSYNWNIAQLKPGEYILVIEMNGNRITRKFMKE